MEMKISSSYVTYALLQVCLSVASGELMISGFGDLQLGAYFVELWTSTYIPDLSVYTLNTKSSLTLPSQPLQPKQYMMAASVSHGDLEQFFEKPIPNFCESEGVDLTLGKVPVSLEKNGSKIDVFGEDSSNFDYKNSWVRRVFGAEAPKTTYHADDWEIPNEAFEKCWIDATKNVNSLCDLPYGDQTFEGEYAIY